MRKLVLAALAIATMISGGIVANRAAAMMPARAAVILGAASADAPLVREAVVVCGSNGCVPVHVSRSRPRRP